MTFHDPIIRHAAALELLVHVAGKYECAVWNPGCHLVQQGKSGMWHRCAIKLQTVSVKAPRQLRVLVECFGVGYFGEAQVTIAEGRVGAPEARVTPGNQAGRNLSLCPRRP